MKKKLVIFTIKYPFEFAESFLHSEVLHLQKTYNVIIIPLCDPIGEVTYDTGEAIIKKITLESNSKFSIKAFSYYFSELFYQGNFYSYFRYFRYYLGYAAKQLAIKRQLHDFLKRDIEKETIFYSYWFANNTLSVSLLAKELKLKSISRAHGYDLYDERWFEGRIPYRKTILKNISALVCISKTGEQYLKERTPKKLHYKILVSRLGSDKFDDLKTTETDVINIVTCSRIIKLKRIDLIARLLATQKTNINWHLIGDGEELNAIKDLTYPSNINPIFRGQLANKQVHDLYQSIPFDLFILLSETEGIPYSMMEAISYGVPVFSSNVGAIKELVNKDTGVLVKVDAGLNEMSQKLNETLEKKWNRTEIRKFHSKNFSTENNTNNLISILETKQL